MAAPRSSNMIPHPCFSLSRDFNGGGLMISSMRYMMKPVIITGSLRGTNKNTIKMQANSSMTIIDGSLVLDSASMIPADITPIVKSTAKTIRYRAG